MDNSLIKVNAESKYNTSERYRQILKDRREALNVKTRK